MDAATVSRVMSLVPERTPRAPTGSALVLHDAHPPRIALLLRFLHWLTPLEVLSREEQQALGVRAGAVRPLGADEEADAPPEPGARVFEHDPDPTPVRPPEAGQTDGVRA